MRILLDSCCDGDEGGTGCTCHEGKGHPNFIVSNIAAEFRGMFNELVDIRINQNNSGNNTEKEERANQLRQMLVAKLNLL